MSKTKPISKPPSPQPQQHSRRVRDLSPLESRVQSWVKANHGVLSRVAQETGKSVQFVQRVAYNREAQSAGWIVERKLLALGCPLIQKIGT
jgi:phage portal protein BeeE